MLKVEPTNQSWDNLLISGKGALFLAKIGLKAISHCVSTMSNGRFL